MPIPFVVKITADHRKVIMTDTSTPEKKTKAALEQLVKSNGGQIFQTHTAAPNTVCIADRRTPFSFILLKNN